MIDIDAAALERLTEQAPGSVATAAPPAPGREALSLDAAGRTKPLSVSRQAPALSAVAREIREADTTMAAENDTMADYDKVFSVTAGLVSSMLFFAGQKDPAEKVRPSTRRAGQTTKNAESEEPRQKIL